MSASRSATVPRPTRYDTPQRLEFPGCRPVRITRAEIAACERRIEYWDAATETAMVCDPVSTYHEHPGQRLRELLTLIAQVRGSPIATFGAADLLQRDAHGAWQRILEADQTVYLQPRNHAARGRQDRSGQRHAAGRGAGGGQHHRRAPRQAVAVRVVGLPGGVGRGARGPFLKPPGGPAPRLDDPPAGERPLPRRVEQPGLPRLDRAGDSPLPERTRDVGRHHDRVAQDRTHARCGVGNRPRRRPAAAYRAAGEPRRGPCRGPCGSPKRCSTGDPARCRAAGAAIARRAGVGGTAPASWQSSRPSPPRRWCRPRCDAATKTTSCTRSAGNCHPSADAAAAGVT